MVGSDLSMLSLEAVQVTTKVRKVDFSPDEFIAGTAGMTPTELGIFWFICALIYSNGGPIPQNDERLRAVRCDPRTIRATTAALVERGKIEILPTGEMMVRRCRKELDSARKRMQLSAEAASRGGRPAKVSQENQPPKNSDVSSAGNQSPPLSSSSPTVPPKPPRGLAYSQDFLGFWQIYPHKVGKDAAWRAWQKRKDRPELSLLCAAVRGYIAAKPADREYCNPATWLSQGRWADDPAGATTTQERSVIPPCPPGEDKVAWYMKHTAEPP
jgi:uncharacterized protein YdaU (DUF1376 family)